MSQPVCHSCGASNFRLSHIRRVDLGHLLGLQYPVRCRICHERRFLAVPIALAFSRKGKKKNGTVPESGAA